MTGGALRRRHREHDPCDVHAGRRPGDLAELEALDEKSRNYVHCDKRGTMGELRHALATGSRSDQLGLAVSLSVGPPC